MEKAEAMEAKRVARLQSYTDQIIYFGLWQSVETVDAALQEIETRKEQKEALKAQINFRKYVLKQSPPKNVTEYDRIMLFIKTENNTTRELTVEELTANVKNWCNMLSQSLKRQMYLKRTFHCLWVKLLHISSMKKVKLCGIRVESFLR